MIELNDKVVIVTGGAGLIGSSIVEKICECGGIAVIADTDKKRASDVKADILKSNSGYKIEVIETDICNKKMLDENIRYVNSVFGRIDALINNAYPRNKNYGRKFEDVEYEDFCENVNLHLGGYFLTCQRFSEFFVTQGFGNIINISSIYGVVPPRFEIYENTEMTNSVEYAAIKSGLIHLTKYIVKYYKGKNLRINTVSLGGIFDNQPESFLEAYKKFAANKGMLDRSDIVGTIAFILSDESKYINGQNIVIDDGWSL